MHLCSGNEIKTLKIKSIYYPCYEDFQFAQILENLRKIVCEYKPSFLSYFARPTTRRPRYPAAGYRNLKSWFHSPAKSDIRPKMAG